MRTPGNAKRLVLALLVVGAANAAQGMTLKQAMQNVSGGVARQLVDLGAERVRVSAPRGPVDDAASARMQLDLVAALQRELDGTGIAITNQRPDVRVDLEYVRSDDSSRYAMTIRLMDRGNKSIGSFAGNFDFVPNSEEGRVELAIDEPSDRANLEGRTVDATFAPDGTPRPVTGEAIQQALDAEPTVFVSTGAAGANSLVAPRAESKFRIEILARPAGSVGDGEARPVENVDGYAYCQLAEGEDYAVRVVNDADHAVAVDLGIDGINVWRTSSFPAWRDVGKFVVDPHSSVVVRGWHFGENGDAADYRAFRVVALPDSLIAELGGDQSATGQIHAQFFAAWKPGDAQPEVETRRSRGAATGVGGRVESATRNVRYHIGRSLLAAVTVRYTRPDPPADLPGEN